MTTININEQKRQLKKQPTEKGLLNLLAAALKQYNLDNNIAYRVPYYSRQYYYKKVVSALTNIINDTSFKIGYYFDNAGNAGFSIYYNNIEMAFTIYDSNAIKNFKL